MKYSEQLTSWLADYFTGELGIEELWRELKQQKEEGREFMIREAQLKLIDAIKLMSSQADFAKIRSGILTLETLKNEGNYTTLEAELNSIESLCQQYQEERERAFNAIKEDIEKQVKQAAQQLALQTGKGVAVDVQGSVEANARTSPEWKSFVSRHDSTYGERLRESLERLRRVV
jgi:uncharacterized protein YjaZ